jgi:hypothetical protein
MYIYIYIYIYEYVHILYRGNVIRGIDAAVQEMSLGETADIQVRLHIHMFMHMCI